MGRAVIAAKPDTYVSSGNPTARNSTNVSIYVGSGLQTFMLAALGGIPEGATVRSAYLDLYGADALAAASRAVTIARVDGNWSAGTLTYNNRPTAVLAGGVTVTKTAALVKGELWRFDVTAQVQAAIDGADEAWDGWRLTSTSKVRFHSAESATVAYRPTLTVEWEDKQDAPSRLSPAGGRAVSVTRPKVRCDFTDVSGSMACAGIQVQRYATEADALAGSNLVWDSGQVASTVPELDLSATTFAALTTGQIVWWRVRVQDGAGLWSDWSLPASWTFQPLPTLSITQPSGSTVTDATPPIWWTASAQRDYQVRVLDMLGRELGTSGRVTGADTSYTPPAGWITIPGAQYVIEVTVWDAVARELTPGAPIATVASKTVTYSYSGTVVTVAGLTAAQDVPVPRVALTWTRDEVPDSYTVQRDGVVIAAGLDPADLTTGGTGYAWTDQAVGFGVHTYGIVAVVNGAGSQAATVTVTVTGSGAWLLDPDGMIGPLPIEGDNAVQLALTEDSSLAYALGATSPVYILAGLRGYEGPIDGTLWTGDLHDFAATPADLHARALAHRAQSGTPVWLVYQTKALRGMLHQVDTGPMDSAQTDYYFRARFAELGDGHGVPL